MNLETPPVASGSLGHMPKPHSGSIDIVMITR